MTVAEALKQGAYLLAAHGADAPRLNAELLLAFVLGVDRTRLLASFPEQLAREELEAYNNLLRERALGKPLQYIVGRQEFWGLEFRVTPDVLIPRPETELVVEQSLKAIRAFIACGKSAAEIRAVDVGTGSGCIAIALARELVGLKIIATDISERALRLARENARLNGVADRVFFLTGNLLDPLAPLAGRLDLLVSNPPYISRQEFDLLQREIRDWEPRIAVTDEADGLSFYRRLAGAAREFLRPGGRLVLELAFGRSEAARALIEAAGLDIERIEKDLQGIDRCLVAKKELGARS